MEANKKESLLQALKFLLFSISAGVIQIGVFTLLELIGLSYWISNIVALISSVVWNFTFNRKFTFKSANNVPIAMLKVALFYAVFTPLSTIGGNALVKAGWNDFLVEALVMVTNFVTEFFYSKYVTFRGSINSAVNKDKEPVKVEEKAEEKEDNSKENNNEKSA